MSQASIAFRFADKRSAELAFDTLNELGYEPVFHPGEPQPTLHIHVVEEDLTSALEIAQAHGGTLLETDAAGGTDAYTAAYALDTVPIPAHVVNEDWTDDYAEAEDGERADRAAEPFDPSAESYNHFPAGVRL